MFSYKQVLKQVRQGEHKDLFNKLSDEDYEILFNHKTLGIFSQIKSKLKEASVLSVELPKIGRLEINPVQIKKKLKILFDSREYKILDLNKPLLLIEEKKKYQQSLDDVNSEILKYVELLIEKYNMFELQDCKTTEERKNMEKNIYIDPLIRKRVESLLGERGLTIERFVFEMKQINTPVIKSWFLVSYQILNDLVDRKNKNKSLVRKGLVNDAKMSKSEFKKILEDAGLYVDSNC